MSLQNRGKHHRYNALFLLVLVCSVWRVYPFLYQSPKRNVKRKHTHITHAERVFCPDGNTYTYHTYGLSTILTIWIRRIMHYFGSVSKTGYDSDAYMIRIREECTQSFRRILLCDRNEPESHITHNDTHHTSHITTAQRHTHMHQQINERLILQQHIIQKHDTQTIAQTNTQTYIYTFPRRLAGGPAPPRLSQLSPEHATKLSILPDY